MTPEQREELKAAALAADQDCQHIYTNPRDSNNWSNNETWHAAASPAVVLSLIAQVEALTVPQWISVEDRLPEDRQDVTFVVRASGAFEYLNGRVLAGTFIASYCGDFSVPGLTVGASYWMASPAAPTIPAIPGTKEGA